ncbi:hypothetical protein AAG570_003388 [Ranatra chinensis]|uniref:Amidase domain-containing protein n=1 Tax=Ranatra chinensis TaxID=642074 RepID=A0ABD0Y3K9_9HEMI
MARLFVARKVSSESVVRAFVDRCREVNSRINAVVEERFEEAIQDARTVDWLISSGSNSPRQLEEATPLLGVPITVKESCGLKGMSQCVGCKRRMNARAVDDGHAVGRLRRAGAIPIGVTNTPELCLSWETTNLITGTTSNPYNPCRTAGGSSGGEGAMLGSGCSVIGIGSDLAGSIRIPSMFGGVFGHKPTPGYVPTEGHYPHPDDEKLRKFLVVGPMSRYAEDLLLAMKVMSGQRGKELCLDEQKLLGDDGVLFYPTFPIPPFYHNEFFLRCLGIMYTMVFNTLELPSTHVPLGLDSQGLPIGIQVIGGHKQDRLCIAVARALEARFGGWIPPPSKIL